MIEREAFGGRRVEWWRIGRTTKTTGTRTRTRTTTTSTTTTTTTATTTTTTTTTTATSCLLFVVAPPNCCYILRVWCARERQTSLRKNIGCTPAHTKKQQQPAVKKWRKPPNTQAMSCLSKHSPNMHLTKTSLFAIRICPAIQKH